MGYKGRLQGTATRDGYKGRLQGTATRDGYKGRLRGRGYEDDGTMAGGARGTEVPAHGWSRSSELPALRTECGLKSCWSNSSTDIGLWEIVEHNF
jgi:hypothetical protein